MNHSGIVVQLFCLVPVLCCWCTVALWYPPPLVMQLSNIIQLSWCTEKFWYGGTYIFSVTKPYWEIGRLHTWHGMLSMKWKIKQRLSIGTKIYSDEHLCTWQSHLRSRLVRTQVATPPRCMIVCLHFLGLEQPLVAARWFKIWMRWCKPRTQHTI